MKFILSVATLLMVFNIQLKAQTVNPAEINEKTKVAVWDTYVTRKDGSVMHFDIIAPAVVRDTNIIYQYGRDYLKSKGQEGQRLSSKECRFCHVRQTFPEWIEAIRTKGYFILEMENCN